MLSPPMPVSRPRRPIWCAPRPITTATSSTGIARQNLFKDGLISKSDFDSRKNAWATADAGLVQAQARVAQAKAQKDSADKHVTQASANLTHYTDVLQKTTYLAPYDGVITNLPVREGETVVIGIQNAQGSTLMTIADMSVITAEVKVDETDIVNVHLGQPAEVTIDAIPNKIFHGNGFRNWRQRHRALQRRLHFAIDHGQRRSQRFQSRGHADGSADRSAARAFDHGKDHHRDAQQCPGYSHSGADPAHQDADRAAE